MTPRVPKAANPRVSYSHGQELRQRFAEGTDKYSPLCSPTGCNRVPAQVLQRMDRLVKAASKPPARPPPSASTQAQKKRPSEPKVELRAPEPLQPLLAGEVLPPSCSEEAADAACFFSTAGLAAVFWVGKAPPTR